LSLVVAVSKARPTPFFGIAPGTLTDIHAVLGTTPTNRVIDNVTNSGIIDNLFANGQFHLENLYAQRLRNSSLAFANRIDNIHTRGPVRNLGITTGHLRRFLSGSDVAGLDFVIAGPLDDFYVTGSVDATSIIDARGPSGRIGRFQVLRSLAGDVRTNGVLSVLAVGRDILSTSRIEADEIPTRYIGGQIFGQIVIT
jgi:hypothetical protein